MAEKKTAKKRVKTGLLKVSSEVAAAHLFGPSGSMAVKLLGSLYTPLAEHIAGRREQRAAEFVDHFMGSGYPLETAVPLLESELRQAPAETKEAVIAVLRALDETLSDRVMPALALLARKYARAGLPRDRFFVNALRVLRELGDAEFDALRALVISVAAVPSPNSSATIMMQRVHFPDRTLLWITPNGEVPWEPPYESLINTLVNAGFVEVSTGLAGSPHPEGRVFGAWSIKREPWVKLATLLQVGPSAPPE
jgi:hypothetical protein